MDRGANRVEYSRHMIIKVGDDALIVPKVRLQSLAIKRTSLSVLPRDDVGIVPYIFSFAPYTAPKYSSRHSPVSFMSMATSTPT